MAEALVNWKAEYNLGVEEIDRQHRALVELLNKAWEGIVFRADKDVILELVEQLERYTIAHFTAEEVYMLAIHYPNLEDHRLTHQKFIARIEAEKKRAVAGGELSLGLVNFLKQWLLEHILGADKAFAEYANQIQVIRKDDLAEINKEKEKANSLLKRIFGRFM